MGDLINASPVAILARLFDPERIEMTPEMAEGLLRIGFDESERRRMHELAAKNREARLVDDERRELDAYILVSDLLAVMQAKARVCLRASKATS